MAVADPTSEGLMVRDWTQGPVPLDPLELPLEDETGCTLGTAEPAVESLVPWLSALSPGPILFALQDARARSPTPHNKLLMCCEHLIFFTFPQGQT